MQHILMMPASRALAGCTKICVCPVLPQPSAPLRHAALQGVLLLFKLQHAE